MDSIRAYLISVVCAAIISALVVHVVGKKDAQSAVVKLLAGLFLSITVISPWTKLRLQDISSYFDGFGIDAEQTVSEGTATANSAAAAIIKERTEAYILDKAATFDASLTVEVILSESTPPVPCDVVISGTVAPYAKQQLQHIIENDLAIPKENQVWK